MLRHPEEWRIGCAAGFRQDGGSPGQVRQPCFLLGVVERVRAGLRGAQRLAPKRVGVVFQIGVDFLLNIIVLRVELVVLRALRLCQLSVLSHYGSCSLSTILYQTATVSAQGSCRLIVG